MLAFGSPQRRILRGDAAGDIVVHQLVERRPKGIRVGVAEGERESVSSGAAQIGHVQALSSSAATVLSNSAQDASNLAIPSSSSTLTTSS